VRPVKVRGGGREAAWGLPTRLVWQPRGAQGSRGGGGLGEAPHGWQHPVCRWHPRVPAGLGVGPVLPSHRRCSRARRWRQGPAAMAARGSMVSAGVTLLFLLVLLPGGFTDHRQPARPAPPAPSAHRAGRGSSQAAHRLIPRSEHPTPRPALVSGGDRSLPPRVRLPPDKTVLLTELGV